MSRILLSIPHMGGAERGFVAEAFDQNWLSTVGPNLDAFEREFSARVGLPAVALASGTAALHLALRLLDAGPGDQVLTSTLTFAASVNPILYQGAEPVFIDSDRQTWNMDPALLAAALHDAARTGRLPKAAVVVHLYGQTADLDPILAACAEHGVPLIEDAAEALGATYNGKPAGTLGDIGAYSFNGNKIITTTGGGMLVARDAARVNQARFWSTQARDPAPWYQHSQLGYNYRMSNVLAGIGRGQLEVLDDRISQRRAIFQRYGQAFAEVEGIEPMPQPTYGEHTNWLSCFLIDQKGFGATRDELIAILDRAGIESRPVWKPMHLQPLYKDCKCYGGEVAQDLFERGICLPSSSSLTEQDQTRVITAVLSSRATRVPQTAI